MSQSEHGRMLAEAMRNIEIATLADQVSQKTIHYGDPPNYGCCPAGATMNSDPLRILQFWQRSKYDRDFKRVPELEIDLDPELIEELGI